MPNPDEKCIRCGVPLYRLHGGARDAVLEVVHDESTCTVHMHAFDAGGRCECGEALSPAQLAALSRGITIPGKLTS